MTKFGFVTYDIQTPHGLVFIILRYCYYLLRLPLKSLKYKFHLLYDQLTYLITRSMCQILLKELLQPQILWLYVL